MELPKPHKVALNTILMHKKSREELHATWARYLDLYSNRGKDSGKEAPSGSDPEPGSAMEVGTNYPYAFVDTVTSMVVPTKPRIEVIPRDMDRREQADTQSHFINWTLKKERVNQTFSKMVAKVVLYGIGFTKTVWNVERGEVRIYEKDPKLVWPDKAAPRWDEQRFLIEVTVLTEDEFKKRVDSPEGGYNAKVADTAGPGHYPTWLSPDESLRKKEDRAAKEAFKWVVIYEYYDFVNNKLYHIPDSLGGVLAEWDLPYKFFKNPFTPVIFNENLEDLSGLADMQLIEKLQTIMNEIDNLEMEHAAATIPFIIIEKKALKVEGDFIAAMQQVDLPGQFVPVETSNGMSVRDLFAMSPTPNLSPSFDKMRDRLMQAIEFILGLPQYARGVIGVAEVATEAALADATLRTRTGRRIQALNDHLSEVALKVISLYAEFFRGGEEGFVIRMGKANEPVLITRELLGLDDFDPVKYFWEYEALEYSPLDNNRQFRLQQLQVFMPFLTTSPNVDQSVLTHELLDLLKLSHVYQDPPPEVPMDPAAMAGEEGAPPPPGPEGLGEAIPEGQAVSEEGITDPSTGTLMPEVGVESPVGIEGRPVMVDTRS